MGMTGNFIIASHDAIHRVCAEWSPGLETPRIRLVPSLLLPGHPLVERRVWLPEAPPYSAVHPDDASADIAELRPVSWEIPVRNELRELCKSGRVIYYLNTRDDTGGFITYLYELDDDEVDVVLRSWSGMEAYADKALRHAAGLGCFIYVDSY